MLGRSLLIFGILLIAAGLVWAAQGGGYFPYPAESFMINDTKWVFRGAMTALLGLVVVVVSRRLK